MIKIKTPRRPLDEVFIALVCEEKPDVCCELPSGAMVRLQRDQAISIRRKGETPAGGTRASTAWANELATFRRYATVAGLHVDNLWTPIACEPGHYAASIRITRALGQQGLMDKEIVK